MDKYGLLGMNISYSFSRSYFSKKFEQLGIKASYENFDLQEIYKIREVIENNKDLKGLNVTIPYKEQIIPFLNELDRTAAEIGAVNTIKISENGALKGFNTDSFGFVESIKPYLKNHHKKALILGTGGASKAVAYGLKSLDIEYQYVSRRTSEMSISYEQLSEEIMQEHQVIVNCTPLGTSPKTAEYPAVPVELISERQVVFDLIYNPSETRLMQLASEKGATVVNGLRMLELQAERAWEIWNSPLF
ncbi:shikimate 5-dehydrogenase [Salinimicrobium marinum]|uniref:Shikimate 5-dehydrogenase n=1 Tax=Salinimicrobium marinum TaxID=680283 RepID=A0A918SIB4_9FLAO|nr:shikimate dehydrogenase [Salinimicrobium marinum]GHA43970.1 shikimate 5-dehydrogenase [Salinimicrobium marinum]